MWVWACWDFPHGRNPATLVWGVVILGLVFFFVDCLSAVRSFALQGDGSRTWPEQLLQERFFSSRTIPTFHLLSMFFSHPSIIFFPTPSLVTPRSSSSTGGGAGRAIQSPSHCVQLLTICEDGCRRHSWAQLETSTLRHPQLLSIHPWILSSSSATSLSLFHSRFFLFFL